MDKILKDLSDVQGITEESERKANEIDDWEDPSIFDAYDKTFDIVRQQHEADHRCPYCGFKSAATGECTSCGKKWTPPLFH